MSVRVKDAAGNESSATVGGGVVKDTSAPTGLTLTPYINTNDQTPSMAGAIADITATLSLTVAGQTVTPTNNGSGGWTLDGALFTNIITGVYAVTITATDVNANTLTVVETGGLEIDLTSPVLNNVTISSSNALSNSLAKVGDIITVSFTSDDELGIPTVDVASVRVFLCPEILQLGLLPIPCS